MFILEKTHCEIRSNMAGELEPPGNVNVIQKQVGFSPEMFPCHHL